MKIRVPFGSTRPAGEDIEEVVAALRAGQLRMGARCAELERHVAASVGTAYAVAMSSCTAALHACLSMLDVEGREVILPSLTFAATANAVVHARGIPVFADVDPGSLTLSAESVARLVTPATAAIIPVHMFGIPCDLSALGTVAQPAGIPVVEDCAYGLGSRWAGEPVGSRTLLGCFSFHVLKNITTGEGGMVTTSSPEHDRWLREFRNNGMRVDEHRRKSHHLAGLNYRMTEMQAALGVSQMRRLPVILARKREVASWYDALLRDLDGVALPSPDGRADWNRTFSVVRIERGSADAVAAAMFERGIETQTFVPVHQEPFCRKMYEERPTDLRITEEVAPSLLALPSHLAMTQGDVEEVVRALADVLGM